MCLDEFVANPAEYSAIHSSTVIPQLINITFLEPFGSHDELFNILLHLI